MDVSVCCGTFGSSDWARLAQSRAQPSAKAEGAEWIHFHAGTLAEARNQALAEVETEFVIFLDADDELEPGYVRAMEGGRADLRAPSVRYVRLEDLLEGRPYVPRVAGHEHACTAACLPDGNWIVVGALARTEMIRAAGGWHEWPLYEDYDLWLRCWLGGASIEAVPEAIYRAHMRPDSRNRAPAIELKNDIHRQIIAANLPGVPA